MKLLMRAVSALLICITLVVCGACAVKIDPPADMSSEDEALNMGFAACKYNSKIVKGEYQYLDVEIKLNYEREVRWSSSDPEIATVDSNGRVDGIKEGNCIITASAKSASVDYEIQVVKAEKKALSYTTAIIDNQETIEGNKANISDKNLYAIIVNKYNNCVTVFTYDSGGVYSVPVRAMACSTGKDGNTPDMDSAISEKAEWVYLSDNNYYRYATYFGEEIMFQSAPYSEESEDSLIYEEYNKIGEAATKKNVRLSVADAKWIYDNCSEGTVVKVVDSDFKAKYSPLGVPNPIKLNDASLSLSWDPTDDVNNNPYSKNAPVFAGVEDAVIEAGSGFDPYSEVAAFDTCSNEISSSIVVDGDFDRNVAGRYIISYYVTDNLSRTTRYDRQITVVNDIEEYQSTTEAQ